MISNKTNGVIKKNKTEGQVFGTEVKSSVSHSLSVLECLVQDPDPPPLSLLLGGPLTMAQLTGSLPPIPGKPRLRVGLLVFGLVSPWPLWTLGNDLEGGGFLSVLQTKGK